MDEPTVTIPAEEYRRLCGPDGKVAELLDMLEIATQALDTVACLGGGSAVNIAKEALVSEREWNAGCKWN